MNSLQRCLKRSEPTQNKVFWQKLKQICYSGVKKLVLSFLTPLFYLDKQLFRDVGKLHTPTALFIIPTGSNADEIKTSKELRSPCIALATKYGLYESPLPSQSDISWQ